MWGREIRKNRKERRARKRPGIGVNSFKAVFGLEWSKGEDWQGALLVRDFVIWCISGNSVTSTDCLRLQSFHTKYKNVPIQKVFMQTHLYIGPILCSPGHTVQLHVI